MFGMDKRALTAALIFSLAAASASAQQTVLPLWPHAKPEPTQSTGPEQDVTKPTDGLISGHRTARIANVSEPTLTIYSPPANVRNTGGAALVFPGGGYVRLAWDGEGVDTCNWLTSVGMTCVLVKYRVPEKGYYPDNPGALEDAQQAMRITRAHAREWHIDPLRIGVVGFSAGANLAVLLSAHPDDRHVESTPASGDIDKTVSARANFAVVVYPAYLVVGPENKELNAVYAPTGFTPPTFLIQAENDKTYSKNAPVYYMALADAEVPTELHMFSTGGHGFGIHPPDAPEAHWTDLATSWLESIHMIPPMEVRHRLNDRAAKSGGSDPAGGAPPCSVTMPAPPLPGHPAPAQPEYPNCPPPQQ
jgi:acetyl esterase/lipase